MGLQYTQVTKAHSSKLLAVFVMHCLPQAIHIPGVHRTHDHCCGTPSFHYPFLPPPHSFTSSSFFPPPPPNPNSQGQNLYFGQVRHYPLHAHRHNFCVLSAPLQHLQLQKCLVPCKGSKLDSFMWGQKFTTVVLMQVRRKHPRNC